VSLKNDNPTLDETASGGVVMKRSKRQDAAVPKLEIRPAKIGFPSLHEKLRSDQTASSPPREKCSRPFEHRAVGVGMLRLRHEL
jgi:hypothetical protein